MEPSLGPNIFDETDSKSDSVSELTYKLLPGEEWIPWHEVAQKSINPWDDTSVKFREWLESFMTDI